MDSAYGEVKQNVEITEGETPIFKQLDIDVITQINCFLQLISFKTLTLTFRIILS